ncbi:hypothetical protein [Flavobacterium weaverense]|uniref:Uncharacterized protein n=1 Tax=Flavobacterium weaverense TaxID=271156 RepID=A0A3M0A6Q6_9FLAO|nr:hypothetical protein [Flavobacterium weaverense]RMA74772.1 hypothetical protein BC961_2100 [Flavobacterium weaverense]
MKKSFILFLILVVSNSFAQSINDYSAVIVPLKYDFLKEENQYRLNTLTKYNFINAGFVAFYAEETLPAEYNDRCSVLRANVEKENGFLVTKLYITLRDCNDKVVFKSAVGRSKEKEFKLAYADALNEAFKSIYDLQYKYSGVTVKTQEAVVQQTVIAPAVDKAIPAEVTKSAVILNDVNMLYAQATATGFQLIDSTPKVVMKLMKTSQPNSFIAIRDAIQGSLILKENQWFFEYYKNDQLVSERVNVKF